MWNCGVMEEGVECMVELVNGNKGVVVITNSTKRATKRAVSISSVVSSAV